MAINRGAKPGQTLRVTLLCDPLYQSRRAEWVASGVVARHPETDEEADAIRVAVVGLLRESEARYAATLDPACLLVSLDGVSQASIRALSGAEFEAADARVPPALGARGSELAMVFRRQVEMVRSGLAWMDGDPPDRKGPYDVDALASQVGSLWPELRTELAGRIEVYSTLGEPAGSSCAPSAAEPT